MSNDRSPREVCSTTIGTSGFNGHRRLDGLEHVYRHAVGLEPFDRLRDRQGHEDLDRPRAGGAPAVSALDGRAPEQHSTEDARLGADVQVVLPGLELAGGVDPARARGARRFVPVPEAARADRLLNRPRVTVEHAHEQAVLDPPDLPADRGPERLGSPRTLEPADPHSCSSASHARIASREKRHSSPTFRPGSSLLLGELDHNLLVDLQQAGELGRRQDLELLGRPERMLTDRPLGPRSAEGASARAGSPGRRTARRAA